MKPIRVVLNAMPDGWCLVSDVVRLTGMSRSRARYWLGQLADVGLVEWAYTTPRFHAIKYRKRVKTDAVQLPQETP